MHLFLILSVLNQSIMILIFNLFESSSLENGLDFISCEVVRTCLVTADIKILFQFLIRPLSQSR
jgi:hypothetical protein